MTSEESTLFELLDDYSRTRFNSFLAEMFLNKDATKYVLCFRPNFVNVNSPQRYLCRYIQMEVAIAAAAAREKMLHTTITNVLDQELTALKQDASD